MAEGFKPQRPPSLILAKGFRNETLTPSLHQNPDLRIISPRYIVRSVIGVGKLSCAHAAAPARVHAGRAAWSWRRRRMAAPILLLLMFSLPPVVRSSSIPCTPVQRPPLPRKIPPQTRSQPHFVTLLIDDLGFDDCRSHDVGSNVRSFTPTIATLLKDGVLLDRHHAYKWCSPSRRSFLTGRFPVSITGKQAATASNLTPLQFTILSEKLAAVGYESHFVGKGHLGWQTTDHLLVNRGFASHVGYLGGSEAYKWGGGSENPTAGHHDLWHNAGPAVDLVPEVYYSTNFYSEYAVARILQRNQSRPLWLHVAYQAVHSGAFREDTPAEDDLQDGTGFRNQGYGSALVSLDHGVRNITQALRTAGMWNNTLMIFVSDNGGDDPPSAGRDSAFASNFPLLGRKCLSYEGGTRVFAFVNGGLLPAGLRGTTNTQLMHIADWYPTLCTLAGVDPSDNWVDPVTNTLHPIDGESLWDTLLSGGKRPLKREWVPTTATSILYDTRSAGGNSIWKLITNETQGWRFHSNGSEFRDPHNPCLGPELAYDCVDAYGTFGRHSCYACSPEQPCLFDVLRDPGETTNLATSMPTMVTHMHNRLRDFADPYVPELSPGELACYNCSFDAQAHWHGYVGPGCIKNTVTDGASA